MRIVAVGVPNVESTNVFPLRIAPPANAIIESNSPTTLEFGSAVRVTGQGFFATRDQIKLHIGEIEVDASRVSPLGDWFSAVVPPTPSQSSNNYDAGARNVSVSVWGVPAQIKVATLADDQPLRLTLWRRPGVGTDFLIAATALATGVAIVVLIYLLYRTLNRRRGLVAALLFEPESQTYSLKTYATSTGLPPMPTEMLALMGISSAGYLGGKLARKPGPIIQRVEVSGGSVVLKIFGQHLSVNSRILVNSVEVARNDMAMLEPDPEHPNEFIKAVRVTVPETIARTADEWYSQSRVVVLVNEDTQRAEWELELPTVTSVEVSDPDAGGKRVVTVTGLGIGAGAAILVPGVEGETAAGQDRGTTSADSRATPPAPPAVSTAQSDVVMEAHRREGDEAAEEPGSARDE